MLCLPPSPTRARGKLPRRAPDCGSRSMGRPREHSWGARGRPGVLLRGVGGARPTSPPSACMR
eukprot:12915450-Prorocentrum_lima.AAC.1